MNGLISQASLPVEYNDKNEYYTLCTKSWMGSSRKRVCLLNEYNGKHEYYTLKYEWVVLTREFACWTKMTDMNIIH